jgi:hypothetical protein
MYEPLFSLSQTLPTSRLKIIYFYLFSLIHLFIDSKPIFLLYGFIFAAFPISIHYSSSSSKYIFLYPFTMTQKKRTNRKIKKRKKPQKKLNSSMHLIRDHLSTSITSTHTPLTLTFYFCVNDSIFNDPPHPPRFPRSLK